MTAARHTRQILQNTRHVVALELFVAARALELQIKQNPKERFGVGTKIAYQKIRQTIPYQAEDHLLNQDIQKVHDLISSKEIVQAVQSAIPDLS
jgi:histidine ammonia-lyase